VRELQYNINEEKARIVQNAFDLNGFKDIIAGIREGNKNLKIEKIASLITYQGLITHHLDKTTKRKVLSAAYEFEYPHELHTSLKLTGCNYDVLFVPNGYFKRHEKKFDVFLLRDHILLETDLKCVHSCNPDTIGKRIREGSEQASRVVLDVHADIKKSVLIDGLKLGCQRNNALTELLLFYKTQFYRLAKSLIVSKNIYHAIK